MIPHLRIPTKLFVSALSVSGVAVAGAVWTFHERAGVPSNVPTFVVTVPTNGNHNRAKSTVGRGSSIDRRTSRTKTRRGDRYVSQMLTLAAGNSLPFRLENRNLGFGANGLDVFVNGVQKEEKLDSVKEVSFNLGHLVVASGGRIPAAFAENPSIFQGARPPNGDDEPVHNIPPSSSVPPIIPPSSSVRPIVPPTTSVPPIIPPSNSVPPIIPPSNSVPPIVPPSNSVPPIVPPSNSVPPSPASVPDSGSTFLLMLCCGAGLLIMSTLGSRQSVK